MKSKIAFLCSSTSWSGLEMNHLHSARKLHEKGFEIFVYCLENTPISQFALEHKLNLVYLEKHKRYKYFFAGLKLKNILRRDQITHLIVRISSDLNICSIAKTFSKNKFHLSYFMEMQLGVSKKNVLHTARFKKIDSWICSTHFLKNQVLENTNFPISKITIIPPSLDLSRFKKNISKEEARLSLNLPKSKTILGLIGRIDPKKGQHLLLEALSILKNKELFVCFMGSPTLNETNSYFEELKMFISQNELQNYTQFIPFQDVVANFYKAIDICILASDSETFGMVTIESLAFGTPIIASNSGGTTEILEYGNLGTLFVPRSAIDLAEKIKLHLKQDLTLQGDIQNSIQKYDSQSILNQIITLLKIKK